MFRFIVALAALTPGQPDKPATHEDANPLYRELRSPGLLIDKDIRAELPPPTVPDGLMPAEQTAAIKKLIGNTYSLEDFTRKSVVAPYTLRLRDIKTSDPKVPARGVDISFIAYGDFDGTDTERFIDLIATAAKESGRATGKALTGDDLAKRKFTPAADGTVEKYAAVTFDFLGKVRLRGTSRAVVTRTAESVVGAAVIDSRFAGDTEFPNEWQPVAKSSSGAKSGSAQTYDGAGFYLKVTRLAEPAGAMFVEVHIVFNEPAAWFEGANLLRSKFPFLVQETARAMRRELNKGEGGK
ncbi:MAG TPA: hypothetical protein VKE40_13855 [Gemmataceae bacterium]|nr:hypothetical protein [Gemmataceae bacterium]